uniref:Uncharacterized protein n=1 Tax=Arundo donax TaxID=35708 RepID=A0A0A9GMY5_ARUDO
MNNVTLPSISVFRLLGCSARICCLPIRSLHDIPHVRSGWIVKGCLELSLSRHRKGFGSFHSYFRTFIFPRHGSFALAPLTFKSYFLQRAALLKFRLSGLNQQVDNILRPGK